METTTKRFFSISWTASKVSNLEEQWSVMVWRSLPGTTSNSGGFALRVDTPITKAWLPSTSFSVACTKCCWGAALFMLSNGMYICTLHPLTPHPKDDMPHRTQKQTNVEKVIIWDLGEDTFPPLCQVKQGSRWEEASCSCQDKKAAIWT